MDIQSVTTLPLAKVADALAFCEAGQGKFAQISQLVLLATRQIEYATGRVFSPQSAPIVEMLTSRDTKKIGYDFTGFSDQAYTTYGTPGSGLAVYAQPSSYELVGVNVDPNTVEVRYDPYGQFDDTTILSVSEGDYFMDGDTLVMQRGTMFRPRALKVTYSSGFPVIAATDNEPAYLSPVPPELSLAAMIQTQFMKVRSRPDNIGFTGERHSNSKDRQTFAFPFSVQGGVCPEAASLIAPYKIMVMGNQ